MNKEEQDLTDPHKLRMNAEKKQVKQQIKSKVVMETDVKRQMHKLQVHQIELEMQNEELRRVNETKETALRKYTMLYDFSPMGYFTLDCEGNLECLNFTGAEMLGARKFGLMGSNFKFFVSGESKVVFITFLDKVYAGISKESCEVGLCYDKKQLSVGYYGSGGYRRRSELPFVGSRYFGFQKVSRPSITL